MVHFCCYKAINNLVLEQYNKQYKAMGIKKRKTNNKEKINHFQSHSSIQKRSFVYLYFIVFVILFVIFFLAYF